MLSIDGSVIDPSELIRRVSSILETVADEGAEVRSSGTELSKLQRNSGADGEQLSQLGELHARLSPPDISSSSRFPTLRRLIRKGIAWFSEPRFQVLEAMEGINIDVLRRLEVSVNNLTFRVDAIERQLTSVRRQVSVSLPRSSNLINEYESFVSKIERIVGVDNEKLDARLQALPMFDNLLNELKMLREFSQLVAVELNRNLLAKPEINYLAFEDEFRGSQENVSKGQFSYLQYIPGSEDTRLVLDIGCGRGEMLELLQSVGHIAQGIDLSTDMVGLCQSKGLKVELANALQYLQSMPNDTYKALFCSQVVEHLSTSELEVLVSLMYQKLGNGGVVIIETINPRSLYSLGNHFYADMTHVRPVHPETLRFLCEGIGFTNARVIEKSPHEMMEKEYTLSGDTASETLKQLVKDFYGYQDFAVIAKKCND